MAANEQTRWPPRSVRETIIYGGLAVGMVALIAAWSAKRASGVDNNNSNANI